MESDSTMTTYTQFSPQSNVNFQFNPTLDGVTYIAICTWNICQGQYYISIFSTARNLIMIRPMTGSPDNFDINLLFGYFFTSTLVYRVSSGNIEVNP